MVLFAGILLRDISVLDTSDNYLFLFPPAMDDVFVATRYRVVTEKKQK